MAYENNRHARMPRRAALKTLGAGIVGSVGLTAASQPVAADTTWGNSDEVHYTDGTYQDEHYEQLGAGLENTDEYITSSGHYQTEWKLAGDGVVLDEYKEFPVPEGEYEDVYPRDDHPWNVSYQGLTIEVEGDISVDIDPNDSDDKYMFPDDGDEDYTEYGSVVADAASVAFNFVPAGDTVSAVLDGAELAGSLLGLYKEDTTGTTYDLTESYSGSFNGFLRGGFGFGDLIIIADAGDYGTVHCTYDYGYAQTGFEIYVQYDGMAAYYDVTKK